MQKHLQYDGCMFCKMLYSLYTLYFQKKLMLILMSGYLLFTPFCERRFYFNMVVHIWNSSETSHKTINVWKRQNLLKLICIMCTFIFRMARNLEPAVYVQKSLLKCITQSYLLKTYIYQISMKIQHKTN